MAGGWQRLLSTQDKNTWLINQTAVSRARQGKQKCKPGAWCLTLKCSKVSIQNGASLYHQAREGTREVQTKKQNKTKHEHIAAPLKGCVALYPNHKASLLRLAPIALCFVSIASAVG